MILPCLTFAETADMGRGVFTSEDIPAGTIVEVSPVIVMEETARKLLDQTLLHDYIFEWGHARSQCAMALGYVALYNHSGNSNCTYEMDYDERTISVHAVRDISAGEELFINYNGDWNDDRPVWFENVDA
jgi:uncharacterized protein